ncbi:hypothetical protein BDV19DRAFT_383834 [Aspergillus venezuelensis]
MESRKNNPYLQDLKYYLDRYRKIQNTYILQPSEHTELHPHGRYTEGCIYLLWGYNRLWGVFNFAHTEDVFLIDPAPEFPAGEYQDPERLHLTWRGNLVDDPEGALGSTVFKCGDISIDILSGTITGTLRLNERNADGIGEGPLLPCRFKAKVHFGPATVPYTLGDVVRRWNAYAGGMEPEEKIKQDLSQEELDGHNRSLERRRVNIMLQKVAIARNIRRASGEDNFFDDE